MRQDFRLPKLSLFLTLEGRIDGLVPFLGYERCVVVSWCSLHRLKQSAPCLLPFRLESLLDLSDCLLIVSACRRASSPGNAYSRRSVLCVVASIGC